MKINECDDGNRIDKDGCTSDCRIERGYKCRGGSPTSIDKCQRIMPIQGEAQVKVDSTINSERGSLVIKFDEKVKVNPIHVKDIKEKIKVFLNGTCENTDLKYTIDIIKDKQGYETVKISYKIDFNVPEKSKCVRIYSFSY
jgi:cysteine-rich repeat protein